MSFAEQIDRITRRRSHFRAVFAPGKSSDMVLADLKRFCRAGGSPLVVSPQSGMVDPIATGVAIGRLEVFNRIIHHLHMDDSQLLKLKEENNDR